MLLLTLRDLQYRATRFAVVILATALVFTLLLLMTALSQQFDREPRETVDRLGASEWILREGASGAFTSAATMDPRVASRVRGRATLAPIVIARHSMRIEDATEDIVVVGFVPGGLGEPDLLSGKLPRRSGEVAIADASELEVGDDLRIGSSTYRVTGLVEESTIFAGMPLTFMQIGDAQQLLYRGQKLATALLADGEVGSVPAGLQTVSNEAIVEDAIRPLKRSISSINLVRGLLWIVAAMIIGAVVYLSAMERQRDFAILKAVGSADRDLLLGVAIQGVLVAAAAALLAAVLQIFLVPVFPLRVVVTAGVLIQLPIAAIVISLIASAAGLRRVSSADPAAAFAGAGG